MAAPILQPLTTRSQPTPAPPVVALLLGALPTFIVLVGLLVFGSVWAAVFGVELSWVLSPAVVCWAWPASRKGVADDWHAATRRLRLQALVGAAFWLATAASALLGFWLLGRYTGVRRRPCLPASLASRPASAHLTSLAAPPFLRRSSLRSVAGLPSSG